MTYDYESHHADDASYLPVERYTTGNLTPEAIAATFQAVAASAEAILADTSAQTLTTRAAHELTGTLTDAVLAELAAVLTSARKAHGWPRQKVYVTEPGWGRPTASIYTSRRPGGDRLTIFMTYGRIFLRTCTMRAEIACPAHLLWALTGRM